MPLRVCTGFEHGVSDLTSLTKGNTGNKLFDVAAGSPTMQSSAPVRTGTYALELNPSATTETVGWNVAGGTIPASQNRAVLLFAIRFPSALPGADSRLAAIWGTTTTDAVLWFRASDSKLVMSPDIQINTGNQQVGPTVAADTWYVVEIYRNASANPHVVKWTVDGVAQTDATFATAAENLSAVFLADNSFSQTMTARYDDVAVWTDSADITSYPHGAHKVLLLKPDTGGSTAEIGTANATGRMVTNSAIDATHNSANILAATSEVPPLIGASATGVGQRTSGTGNAVGIPMTTYTLAGGETSTGLRILIVGWAATTTAASIGMRCHNGTTERILATSADQNFDNNTTSPAWLCKMAIDGDFNAQAEIDALVVRLGYSADISPLPGAHAIYAEVAVKEAAGGQTVNAGQVTETETAQAVTLRKTETAAQTTETETAQPVAVRRNVASGQITETETARVVTLRKTVILGQAVETELAQPISVAGPIEMPIGQVVETETAQSVTLRKTEIAVQVVETETAQPITLRKTETAGQPVETETARPVTLRKTVALGQAVESELAQPVAIGGTQNVPVGEAVEAESAQPVTLRKTAAAGRAAEAEAAQSVTIRHTIHLGQVIEVESAQLITSGAPYISAYVEVIGTSTAGTVEAESMGGTLDAATTLVGQPA